MKLSLSFLCPLFIFWRRSAAMLINQTIDDTDPVVKYDTYKPNDAPIRCNSTACPKFADADFKQLIAGTVTSVAGQITIPFTGTSVWVFLGTMNKIGCAFHIDGKDVGSFKNKTKGQGSILGYSSTALPKGSHQLVIISEQGGSTDFDALVYQSEASPSSVSSSVSSSAPSSAFSAASTASAHSKSRNAVIIGSVVGGSVFLFGVSSMVFLLWRRSRRWRNLAVEQPFPIDEKEPASPVSNVAEHLRRLEARFRRIETLATILQRSSRRSVPSQSSGRSSPPSYNAGSVS
ncbi:hypothetical protein DFH08DRAFT_118948 [Mycena albidolilacea]|uniref:Transmembrane protein n=1 Tax=Mycena albidolilacea TaxID=1033008 RepID=A0AAD7EVT5_9AGAR|nr:hypothetical protein DFH08DRAFT_118948 [Mycena albidolilacea]